MIMDNTLISIIVPVYNTEKYLRNCIDSLINQTYHHIEIILVDDGSTDSSGMICDEYKQKDERIRIIHKRNEGVTKARISGYDLSKGEYISFVDSDDTLMPNAIEIMCNDIKNNNVDIIVCQLNTKIRSKSLPAIRAVKIGRYEKSDIECMLGENFLFDVPTNKSGFPLYLCGKLFKKAILKNHLQVGIGYWYGEDMITIYSIMKQVNSIYISDAFLYNYIQHEEQATRKSSFDLFPQYEKIWSYFEADDKQNYFKNQLPRRIWCLIMLHLKIISKKENYKVYDQFVKYINHSAVINRILFDNFVHKGHVDRFHKYLIQNNFSLISFILIKYRLIDRLIHFLKK